MKRIRFFNIRLLPLIFLLSFNSHTVIAQKDFASLRKNINSRAQELKHELNASKDTLIISCKQKIHRLYSVGKTDIINKKVNAFSYQLPLRDLDKGKYLMVAQLQGKKIVFELNILLRKPFSQDIVSEILASGFNNHETERDALKIRSLIKAKILGMKPYNLSDLDRRGMQSREECRRLMALERAKIREELKQKRQKTLAMR